MNEVERTQLESEVEVAGKYKAAWETVSIFAEEKEAQLFEAFKSCPSDNPSGLVNIRMQFNAVESLRQEFLTYIETGKLASQSLMTEEEEKNG